MSIKNICYAISFGKYIYAIYLAYTYYAITFENVHLAIFFEKRIMQYPLTKLASCI